MEEIKAPKKERKFLKAIGNIGKVLAEELVMGIARKFIGKAIDKVGNKKQGLVIAFIVLASSFVFAQFPSNPNKQRLGFQTTADGLVWRGSISDTASIQPVSNQNAWVILDTVNLKIYSFDFTSNVWNQVGGGAFAQPIDSLFFNVNVPTNNVDTAKMRWDSDLATVVLGLNDNVSNELGFKNFWLVKNQTGSTITKGSLVYANGTVGASGRITVAKFIANGTIDAKYLLGITAHDLSNGEDGYVISFGKIRQVNTDTFAAGAILYPSPTIAGVWTDVEPIAPNLDMPIGFCINSHVNNGTIAIRVASGYSLNELHDTRITSPVNNASLYYKSNELLWRDTTAALLVSDTATMLANYATKAYADTSGRFYARQDFTNVSSSTLTWTQSDTLVVGGVNVVQVYRNGQILLPTQYTIPTNASVVIGATAYKVGENYTVIFPRGGGAGSGGGSGSLTSISGGTGIIVNPNPITTTGTVSADLSVLMELTDTSLLNLTTRFASKLNATDTASLSNRIDAKGTGTVTSVGSGFGLLGGTITTTGTLRLDTTTIYARLQDSINVAIGGDTIKILKQEYQPASSSVLTWTITPKFPIQLKAYILVFRNGQLLNNDQYNLTDTNKITIVSTSFKIGANYTVATVSGIGSVGSAQAGNPVYPEAGIALSTGTTWASSITNNSSNWNTAFTDRLKWDGGSTGLVASTGRTSLGGTTIGQSMFTLTNPSAITYPQFNADNSVTTLSAASFRSAIGVGTVTSVIASTTAGNPISITNTTTTPTIELLSATSARNGYLTSTDWTTFNNKQAALGFTPANSTITIATTEPLQGGGNLTANRTLSILSASETQSGIVNTSSQLFGGSKVFKNRVTIDSVFTLNTTSSIPTQILGINTTGNVNSVGKFTLGSGLNITLGGTLQADTSFLFTQSDTLSLNLTSRFATKLNYTDTSFLFTQSDTNQLNLTNRFNLKANINSPTFTGTVGGITKSMVGLGNVDNTSDANKPISTATQTALNLKFNTADTTSLNLTSRFATKLNYTDTSFLFTQSDTNQLNLTNRFTAKQNILVSGTTIKTVNGTTLLGSGNLSVGTLVGADTVSLSNRINLKFNTADTTSLNLTSRFATKLNYTDTSFLFTQSDTNQLNLTNRFAAKQNTLNGTGFVKASGTNITYDNSSYLRTGLADSTYLKLTGGTLTGALNGTRLNLNSGIDASGDFSTSYHTNVSALFRGYQVLIAPNNDYGQTRIHFPNRPITEGFSEFGSGVRHKFDGNDARNSFLSLYTSSSSSLQIDAVSINSLGNVGINDTTPSFKLDVNGTLGVTGAATLSSTLAVTEAVTLSTTTATPTSLLGKDGSNVVGTVTTVAQTGLMTRDIVTNASTISGSELINVTHGFITEPTAVLLTVFGSTSYILQVASKNSSTFTVQVKNYDGTPAINATLISFSWLAIK
jgi:hypothetical protein